MTAACVIIERAKNCCGLCRTRTPSAHLRDTLRETEGAQDPAVTLMFPQLVTVQVEEKGSTERPQELSTEKISQTSVDQRTVTHIGLICNFTLQNPTPAPSV